jgi:scyllo-inositol 2-dehydrogenase (NADP+)
MKILRTAVIGLGRAGWQIHIPEIIRHKNFELIAVVDPLEERLQEAKDEYDVKGYSDYQTLLNSEKPDLIVITSPTHVHAEHAIAAFKNGVDVFCDKPMALSLQEADRMIASMKEYDRKLMVYQPHRAYVETVALQNILSRDLIGSVYMIKRSWTRYRIRVDWQAFRKYGGGELSNSGAHFIDQLLYLSGSSLKKFFCSLRQVISRGDAEDVAKIIMETANGIILDLDINMAAAIPITPWQVLGERGSIIWDEDQQAWLVRFYKEEEFSGIELQNSLAAKDRSYCDDQDIPWQEMTFPVSDFQPIDFYDKCYEYYVLNKDPFVPVTQSREIMNIIETCRKNEENNE